MKLLLDEFVTCYVKRDLSAHDVYTIEEAGLKGLANGALLRAASDKYDVFITVDNIPYQQNLSSLPIAVLVLAGKRNSYRYLKTLMPRALDALATLRPGDIVLIQE